MNDSQTPTDNDEAIEAAAAAWLLQQEDGFTPEQATEFTRWLNTDPRHAAAIEMLEETCGILGKLPLLQADPARRGEMEKLGREQQSSKAGRVMRFPRRGVVRAVLAIAACVTLAVAGWGIRSARETFRHTYVASTSGAQRIVLPDESVMQLSAATEVRVQFSGATRRVTLVRGEAHFTVAKNSARPFLVGASTVAVRAVGTAFNVRIDPTAVEVFVTEGQVQIMPTAEMDAPSSPANAAARPALFVAGQRVLVSTADPQALGGEIARVDASTLPKAADWQAPRLVFLDAPLSEVVRQFNRHNRVQLEIGDAELGERAVGGTFRADSVETFVRLLKDSRDIAVEQPDASRLVLRRVAPQR